MNVSRFHQSSPAISHVVRNCQLETENLFSFSCTFLLELVFWFDCVLHFTWNTEASAWLFVHPWEIFPFLAVSCNSEHFWSPPLKVFVFRYVSDMSCLLSNFEKLVFGQRRSHLGCTPGLKSIIYHICEKRFDTCFKAKHDEIHHFAAFEKWGEVYWSRLWFRLDKTFALPPPMDATPCWPSTK